MPYKFGEYVSTYVDPNSVKISEALQERFLSTFAANDQLATAIDQMQAALPFENDMQRKRQLQREMENKLTVLSERGDYENLGFQVHKAAKDFTKEYSPIKENYARYQTALQELQKGVDAKEINAEYAQMFPAYMTRNYKGFEIDPETGRVKEGTMFSAPSIIKDPKVFDKIKDAITIIKPEGREIKSNQIGVGADGRYNVTTESGTEYISPEVVEQAIGMVMNDPDVRAYTTQVADMKAYSYQKSGALPEVINSQTTQITKAITAYQEAIDKGRLTTAEKKQAANNIVALNEELQKLAAASGDEKIAYDYVRNKIANEMYKPMTDFVVDAASYQKTKQSTIYDENQAWLAKYKSELDYQNANPEMTGYTSVTADVRDGATIEEQRDNMNKYFQASIEAYSYAELEGLDEGEKIKKQAEGKRLKAEAMRIQQQINLATDKSVNVKDIEAIDPSIVNTIKEYYGITKSSEVLSTLQKVLYNPNDPANKGLQESFRSKYGVTMSAYLGKTYGGVKNKEILQDGILGDSRGAYVAATEDGAASLWARFDDIATRSDVSDKFKEIKTSTLVHYGALPGLTIEESKVATKAAKDFFTGYVIPAEMEVTVLGGKNIEDWNTDDEAGDKLSGKNLAGYKVAKYGFAPEYGESGGWELQIVNSEGKTATVMMDAKNVTSPQLQNYVSSNAMRFANTVDKYNTRGKGDIINFELEGKTINGKKAGNLTVTVQSMGDGDPLVALSDSSGTYYSMYIDSNGKVQTKTSNKPIYTRLDNQQFKELTGSNMYEFY
jgi:hypothetical protein